MRSSCFRTLLAIALFFLLPAAAYAQPFVTGQIIRPAASATARNILDPDNNGFASKTPAGFGSTTAIPDVDNSEVPYKPVPPYALEPYADLRRGADHLFSDYVPDVNGGAYYMHFDGTNLLFRMRMGTIIPGAKGFSLLIDTDGKFGPTGPNADPNYIPATTGTGGNPGFEMEIVLCTGGVNDGVQIYNVDGTDKPVAVPAGLTGWHNYSQVSIAATSDNGDPDFLLDFYVPASVFTNPPFNLNLATSQIRIIPTTVMSAQAAIGGPKSDIYGLDDSQYPNTNTEYEVLFGAQPGIPIADWGGTGTTTPSKQCTTPPTINTPSLTAGTVTVSGTWTKGTLTGKEQNTASIKVYKKAAATGVITLVDSIPNISTGGIWTSVSFSVSANDVVYAKAVAVNESECLMSNNINVLGACNPSTAPPKPMLDACADPTKGFSGSNYPGAGYTIYVDGINTNVDDNNSTTNTGAQFVITGSSWSFRRGCSGGSNLGKDVYKVYYQNNTTGCQSEPIYLCVTGNGGGSLVTGTAPTLTSKLTPGATSVTGTAAAGATVALAINGIQLPTVTATGGNFSFSNLSLVNGDQITITSYNPATTCPAVLSDVVRCFTSTPLVDNDAIEIGKPITGTSPDPAGTTINVYTTASTTPVTTTTVKSDGTWSTSPYAAVSNTTYYVTAQRSGCSVSTQTSNIRTASGVTSGRCATTDAFGNVVPVATITTNPIYSSTTTLNGGIGNSATAAKIFLYQDGMLLDSSASLTSVSTWSIPNLRLYAGNGSSTGKLTIAIKEGTKEAEFCSNAYFVVPAGCTTPTTGSLRITPEGTQTIAAGQSATYGFEAPTSGVFYSVVDNNTGAGLSSGVWSDGTDFSITTRPLTINTTAVVKGASLTANGESCSATLASRSVAVTAPLPIYLFEFKGSYKENSNVLVWKTALEENASHFEVERSTNGLNFSKIGLVGLQGTGYTYTFIDKQLQSTVNHYRLKMIDKDGSYVYSRVITIRHTEVLPTASVWPNPFSDKLNLEVYSKEGGKLTIQLLNEGGSRVKVIQKEAHKGINTIKLNVPKNLTPGIYILQIQTKDGITQQKLIRITN